MRRASAGRALAALTAALVVTVACGGGGDDDASAGNNENESTTSAEDTTTSTIEAIGPPEWVEVAQDVTNRLRAIGENPDPDLVADVVAEECDCYERYLENTRRLAMAGHRITGDPAPVIFVKHEDTSEEDRSTVLTVKLGDAPWQLLDENGDVLQESGDDASGPPCVSLTVEPDGPGGVYRLHSQVDLTGCPEGAPA